MTEIPNDIKLARARASIFEAAVHKQFPRYVDVCAINDALDAYAAERHRHTEVMEEVRKVLEPFAREAANWWPAASDERFISGETAIKLSHLRAARALLSRLEER